VEHDPQLTTVLGLQLEFLAAMIGYRRSMEDESDTGAIRLMTQAGYDVKDPPKVH
jgi:predicted Zn-dependent protease